MIQNNAGQRSFCSKALHYITIIMIVKKKVVSPRIDLIVWNIQLILIEH